MGPGGGGGKRGGGDALEGKAPQKRPQRRLDRRLEEVAEAVGGGYCRLQTPLKPAFGVRETVAGHRLGALEWGGGGAESVHRLILPGVRTGLQEETVCTAGPQPVGNVLLAGESGPVVPLLTSAAAAAAPRRPSHAGAGNATQKVFPTAVKFGGWPPPHLMWEV